MLEDEEQTKFSVWVLIALGLSGIIAFIICCVFYFLFKPTIAIMMLIITLLFWRNLRCKILLKEQNIRVQVLEVANKKLNIMNDTIRGFKHDFSNFVQSLDGYVQTNNMDGIRKMTESVIRECVMIKNLEVLGIDIINNPAVCNLVTNKFYLAQEQDILMNIESMINFNEINIPIYDLCKILAILLDNAIEAAAECDERKINVRFLKDNSKRTLVIVENTYKDKEIDINKLFEKGYTSKIDKEEHGIGLWNVKKILMRSKNLNLYTTKDNMFVQQLEIYGCKSLESI